MFKRQISCSWVRQRVTYSLPKLFELGDDAILLGVLLEVQDATLPERHPSRPFSSSNT